MRYFSFAIIVCISLITLSPTLSTALQPDDSPDFYYYSTRQKAFMVGDANGVRELFHYKYQGTELAVQGPGWSPSGQWFAFHDRYENITIFSRNGNDVFYIYPPSDSSFSVVWSPIDDYLAIRSSWRHGSRIAIHDIPNRSVLRTLTIPSSTLDMEWLPDGQGLVIYHIRSNDQNTATMTLLMNSGKRIDQEIGLSEWNDSGSTYACRSGSLPYWHKDKVLYINPEGTVLTVADGQGKTLATFPFEGVLRYVDWNPERDMAFVYLQSECRADKYELWLLSLENNIFERVAYTVSFPTGLDGTHASRAYNIPSIFPETLWSPDGKYGSYVTPDAVYIFNVMLDFPVKLDIPVKGEAPYWHFAQWSGNSSYLAFLWHGDDNMDHVFYVNPANFVVRRLVSESRRIRFSPVDQKIAVVLPGCSISCTRIYDLDTGELFEYDLDTEEIIWHQDGNWFIALTHPTVANRIPKFVRVGGDEILEGEVCFLASGCFGWMPD